MKIPGLKEFHEHLPDYSLQASKRIAARLPLFAVIFLILQGLCIYFVQFLHFFDSTLLNLFVSIFPTLLNLFFIFGGTLFAQQGFYKKK